MGAIKEDIAKRWDTHTLTTDAKVVRPRWWKSKPVWRYINANYTSVDSSTDKLAFHSFIQAEIGDQQLHRGLSIACGEAHKELNLIEKNIVQNFDLYDFSNERLQRAQNHADKKGIGDRIHLSSDDALSMAPEPKYDLIYWHAALHHMTDVNFAVEWSKKSLKPGGYFVFNEYIGPSRFQWSDEDLAIATELRASIPPSLIQEASQLGVRIDPIKKRPTVQKMIRKDPSEAADSINILPAINQHFPDMRIVPLGGIIYMMALGDVAPFVKGPEQLSWLKASLCLDRVMSNAGRNYFAAGICSI